MVTPAEAKQPSTAKALAYRCSQLAGASIMAPNWQNEKDGADGQQLRVVFAGDGKRGSIAWGSDQKTYYEAEGLGVTMSSGFAIIVIDSDRVETYAYSAGTTELLFSSTRLGNQVLPNAIKAFRGTCVPDGNK